MRQHSLNLGQRSNSAPLLSLTHPNKELFQRHRALLRQITPAEFSFENNAYAARGLRLNEQRIQHSESTFFMRVAGDSMRGLGIFDGDLLVVDRAVPALDGSVVIAVVNGELTVKQMIYTHGARILRSAHPSYPDLLIEHQHDLTIWGVVQWNAHKM